MITWHFSLTQATAHNMITFNQR